MSRISSVADFSEIRLVNLWIDENQMFNRVGIAPRDATVVTIVTRPAGHAVKRIDCFRYSQILRLWFNRVGIAPRDATTVTALRGPLGTRLNEPWWFPPLIFHGFLDYRRWASKE